VRSLRARLVVQSLCVWNAFVLAVVGLVFLLFADRPAGPIVAVACWVAAYGLVRIGRWAARGTGWNS
jgi:hypothetical protein